MAKATAAKPKSNKLRVDFTGVDSAATVREGDVTFAVKEVTLEKGDKAPYLKWLFEAQAPDKGSVYHNTSLAQQSLWALRTLLEYMEIDVPDGPLDFDLEDLKGELVGGTVYHETYDGKKQARISGFYNVQSVEGEESEAETASDETTTAGGEPGAVDESSADESAPKLSADQIGEMSDEELADVVNTYSLEMNLNEYPTARKKKNAVIDAMETAGHLEAEEATS